MRNLKSANINKHRDISLEVIELYGSIGDDKNGRFFMLSPLHSRDMLVVIASSDKGWDHVSVSLKDRCPTWQEMDFIFRMFFTKEETAMQLHLPVKEHIDYHPYCLHLWRPLHRVPIPKPPNWMIGPK